MKRFAEFILANSGRPILIDVNAIISAEKYGDEVDMRVRDLGRVTLRGDAWDRLLKYGIVET